MPHRTAMTYWMLILNRWTRSLGLVRFGAFPFLLLDGIIHVIPRLEICSSCPADHPSRQGAMDSALNLAQKQLESGFSTPALISLDRALLQAQSFPSNALQQFMLNRILFTPLSEILTISNRCDRIKRLDQLAKIAKEIPNQNRIERAKILIEIAKRYQSVQLLSKALVLLKPVLSLTNGIPNLEYSMPLLFASAELFQAGKQLDRAKLLINRMDRQLRSIAARTLPNDRKTLSPYYAMVAQGYGLLGEPLRVQSLLQEILEPEQEARATISLAIAYANAKQNAEADQIFKQVIQSQQCADPTQLIAHFIQYAKAGQWTTAVQATSRIQDPTTQAKARLEIGFLQAQAGRRTEAIALGRLAAQQVKNSRTPIEAQAIVMQWLTEGPYADRGTPEIMGFMDELQFYTDVSLVVRLMQGAAKKGDRDTVLQTLRWIESGNLIAAKPNASLIYFQQNQINPAIKLASESPDPHFMLAMLATRLQNHSQQVAIGKILTTVLELLAIQTFTDPHQIANMNVSIASIKASMGKISLAKQHLKETLVTAKKVLSSEDYLQLVRSTTTQLLTLGQSDLLPISIAEITQDQLEFIRQMLSISLSLNREMPYSSYDRSARFLIPLADLPKVEQAQKLLDIIQTQVIKGHFRDAAQTTRQFLGSSSQLTPQERNNLLPESIKTIVQVNNLSLIQSAIAMIPDTTIRSNTQYSIACFL
jgi:hypothetical protein